MIIFSNITFLNILDIVHLEIEKGKVSTFFGQSGSGKTTILKLINKMISPTNGDIFFNGENLKVIDSVMHRRNVVMLSQNPVVFEGTIEENLNIGLRFQEKGSASKEQIIEMLEKINLDKDPKTDAAKLSGGEKQRLVLGRVMLLGPEVYLLDEPSSSLDEDSEDVIFKMVTKHVLNENKTLIMVTHSKKIANEYSDRIINISNGRLQ